MDKTVIRLHVFFEDPFWVGVFEQMSDGKLKAAKVTFGAEPKDYDVYNMILKRYYSLRFSPALQTAVKESAKNPKRVQREVKKQLQARGIGTKSQQALKLQQEENKLERKVLSRERKEAEKQRQFDLKQQKRKEKHRGHQAAGLTSNKSQSSTQTSVQSTAQTMQSASQNAALSSQPEKTNYIENVLDTLQAISIDRYLVAVWVVGVIMCILYLVLSLIQNHRTYLDAKNIRDNIYTHPLVHGSFVGGIFSPKIFVSEEVICIPCVLASLV